jgi:phage shock protein PspC (stress-responsive transcriptional regulator)
MSDKKLTRATDGKLFGVCGGLANYFGLDATLVRVIWLLLVLCAGTGILAYIILAILMPKA